VSDRNQNEKEDTMNSLNEVHALTEAAARRELCERIGDENTTYVEVALGGKVEEIDGTLVPEYYIIRYR